MSQSANVCKSFLIHALEVNDVFFFSTGNMHFLLTTIGMAAFPRKGNLFLLKAM